jgi:CNT family concentrative nucleoside transporter
VELVLEGRPVNILDAVARGVTDGLFLALNVAAMLIAFIALISLANGILSFAHTDFQSVLGRGLAPVAWILGVPWQDARAIGNLLGVKLVLNEFVAFSMLGPLKGHIAERSFTIATYALCGFANFASIGIQIGGIGSLEPSRRQDLARLGLRAVLAGTMANYLAAAIAGLLLTS